MEVHGGPWRSMGSMEVHGGPWRSMEVHGVDGGRWRSMEVHGGPRRSMEVHGVDGGRWRSTEVHGGPWRSMGSMEVDGGPWRSTEVHGGRWRSNMLPGAGADAGATVLRLASTRRSAPPDPESHLCLHVPVVNESDPTTCFTGQTQLQHNNNYTTCQDILQRYTFRHVHLLFAS